MFNFSLLWSVYCVLCDLLFCIAFSQLQRSNYLISMNTRCTNSWGKKISTSQWRWTSRDIVKQVVSWKNNQSCIHWITAPTPANDKCLFKFGCVCDRFNNCEKPKDCTDRCNSSRKASCLIKCWNKKKNICDRNSRLGRREEYSGYFLLIPTLQTVSYSNSYKSPKSRKILVVFWIFCLKFIFIFCSYDVDPMTYLDKFG